MVDIQKNTVFKIGLHGGECNLASMETLKIAKVEWIRTTNPNSWQGRTVNLPITHRNFGIP